MKDENNITHSEFLMEKESPKNNEGSIEQLEWLFYKQCLQRKKLRSSIFSKLDFPQ